MGQIEIENHRIDAFLLVTAGLAPTGASAITVEVAKKCNGLLAKAFPPREGRQSGGLAARKETASSKRDYFKKCVAKDGNMDDESADKNAK